jgi:hypothetical protein
VGQDQVRGAGLGGVLPGLPAGEVQAPPLGKTRRFAALMVAPDRMN